MSREPGPTVVLTTPSSVHPDLREVEIVERKGRGHPDAICDGLAEAFSIGLMRAYDERCGTILHHNVDKVLLAAGSSAPRFGGGEVLAPLEIFLAGRATSHAGGMVIPVADIARQTSLAWLRANLHALDPGRDVRIHTLGAARIGGARRAQPARAGLRLRRQRHVNCCRACPAEPARAHRARGRADPDLAGDDRGPSRDW
jgi:hypothetical protein